MSINKFVFRNTFLLFVCFVLCLSLFGCKNCDDIVFDFYQDTENGKYNAIKLDFGEKNSGIYFIDEGYGIWSCNEEKYLFDFDYVPRTQRGGQLMIRVATEQSYYQSVVHQNNGLASFYNGNMVFSGSCEFSNDDTVATVSPDDLYVNEMSIDSSHTVTLTKTKVLDEDIVPLDVALDNMNYVSNAYFMFLSDQNGMKFSCDMANLWVDTSTKTGEWGTNGSIVPIRMKLHEKVPYVEVYDVSGSSEKLILKSYAKVVDDSTIELVTPEGEIFYTAPYTPVTITKTN